MGRFGCSWCLEKSHWQPKMNFINELCTGAAEILLKDSVETQHDSWQLLHPIGIVSKTGHEEIFHGAVKSLHHAIGLRMIRCSAVGLHA